MLTGVEGSMADLLRASLTFAPAVHTAGIVPVVEFSPPLIPQGWSIGIELTFYLMAPLVVLTTRRRTWSVWLWIAAGFILFLGAVRAAGMDFDRFQAAVYKNAVANWFVFFLGGAFYYARRRWGQPFRIEIFLPILVAWMLLLTAPDLGWRDAPPRSPAMFTAYLCLTLLPAAIVTLTHAGRWRDVDKAAGNLCYAMYLNHFVVAALLVWSGAVRHVGLPGTLLFGGAVLTGSTALGAATYLLVERPLDALRARVRGDAVRDVPAVSLRLPLQATAALAGVVLAMLLTPPVGIFVERIAANAPGEAARLSPPFDVRWKPDVTDAGRRAIELELGLTDARPVLRDPRLRTWSYRLRQPTSGRVRSVVTHSAVEDTAHIDRELFQIVE